MRRIRAEVVAAAAIIVIVSAFAGTAGAAPIARLADTRGGHAVPAGEVPCAPGFWSSTGDSPCFPALPGYFVPGPGATSAIPCAPGTYQPDPGATSCLLAPVNYFVPTAGATEATPCPGGTFQPNPGSTSCITDLTITTTKVAFGVVGSAYKATLKASGGTGGYVWSLVDASLPSGLRLSAKGKISGSPTAPANATVNVQVRDSTGDAAKTSLPLTVYAAAADGSGTATIMPKTANAGSSGNVFVIKYKAPAAGALDDGTVEIAVPAGWTAPSITAGADGFVTASKGTVGVSGQLITVTGVTLAPGKTISITYGSTADGIAGVTTPVASGKQTFATTEASTPSGSLTALAISPAVKLV